MPLVTVLWALIWGGMFTDIYYITERLWLRSPLEFFQGVRSLFPLAAAYFALLWILFRKPGFRSLRSPSGALALYGAIGLATSAFLSVEPGTSLYWSGLFLAPILVTWFVLDQDRAWEGLRIVTYVNYAVFFLITLSLLPEALRVGWGNLPPFQQYRLPLGLGLIRTNGAGRFALVVIVVCLVRSISSRGFRRFFWLAFLPPVLFLLTQTQSRTALLGLAVSAMLYVLIRGLDWRYLLVGPIAAGVVFISGFRWRVHGNIDLLLNLTGREYTWKRGLAQIGRSPLLGWGFHADRIMLNSEHMHNSYLHAALQTGVFGLLALAAAFVWIWLIILRGGALARARRWTGERQALLTEAILIVGFLTARGFFESTAAFYGVDLLLLVPAMAVITQAAREDQP